MKVLTSLTTLMAASLALAAPPRAALAQDLPNLRIGLAEDADQLDPTLSRTYVGRIVLVNMCDSLFSLNDKLEVIPQLATSHDWVDSKTLVVKLRPGVVFQDGTPVDAAAVKYSIDRHGAMSGTARKGDVASLDHIDIIDPLTVRFVLKSPDVVFLSQLAVRAGVLVSPKAAEAAGKDFALHPVCAGAYRFVERVAQDRMVLERFPGYWDTAHQHFARVEFRPIVENTARLASLQAGAIEIAERVATNDVETVRANPKLALYPVDGLGYTGLSLNLDRSPPGHTPLGLDARVRQALELAIDREGLVQVVYNGLHAVTGQPVPPSSPFFQPSVPTTKRDPAAARALLAQAGVKTPLPIELIVTNNPDSRQTGEVIQSMAAEAGFDIKLVTMEFASSIDRAQRGDFQAYLIGWSGRPDIDGNVRDLLYSGSPTNFPGYKSAVFDGLIDQARTVSDMAVRGPLYAKAMAQLHQDMPIIYLYSQRWLFGMSAKVKGFVPVADGMIRLTNMTLDR